MAATPLERVSAGPRQAPFTGLQGIVREPSRWRLVVLSLLMLVVELALIRWTAANYVELVNITNFVLLASFLGIGTGFLLAGSRYDLLGMTPVSLAVLVGFVLLTQMRLAYLHGHLGLQSWGGHAPLSQNVILVVLYLLVVAVMAGLGQGLARAFVQFRSLDAYRYDIIGSIGGIVLFSLFSFAGLPPISWGAVAVAGFVVLLGLRQRWWQWLALAAVVAMLVGESLSTYDIWSPYYKITAVSPPGTQGTLSVSADNIPHQTLYPIQELHRLEPFYFFPYRHVTPANLGEVLIIGAGTGNDVDVALAEGARHIDAVEIDPDIVNLGKRYNSEHAYESRRVSIQVDDGRAYLENTPKRYSLILYSLPDSLTALTGQAAPVGLEDYLLTEQAVESARDHLIPGGLFVMYNYYQPFLLDRYATEIDDAFGTRPCAELGNPGGTRRQAVLSVVLRGSIRNCATFWDGRRVAPVTDDRPYPYLLTPSIPRYYLTILGCILLGSLLIVRAAGGAFRRMARFSDLFFMGAAFMLLETKNVVQFALFFGTTWYVNALVFAGVLLTIYAAVEVARHIRLPRPVVLYALLAAALALAWVVPQASLLYLVAPLRFVAATALAFAPLFLANLVFAQRFKDVASTTTAFGANLIGAVLGGVLEYLSLITGFRFLLVLVAGLYALAFLIGRRQLANAKEACSS